MKTLKELKSGNLADVTYIKIAAELETFPEELYTLVDTLEVLDLLLPQQNTIKIKLHN